MKDQSIFSSVIILLILIASSHDNVWISLGENCCCSPLGLKGLRGDCIYMKAAEQYFIASFYCEFT